MGKLKLTCIVAISAALGSLAGGVLTASSILDLDQPIALLSAITALGATFLSFLTLREMESGRVSAARARIGATGSDSSVSVVFDFENGTIPKMPNELALTIRNASGGTARAIAMEWVARSKINVETIAAIQRLVGAELKVSIADSKHALLFRKGRNETVLPLSGSDIRHVGDLGPTQEMLVDVPLVVLNYAATLWIALLADLSSGETISPHDVPTFFLSFTHDSPYEDDIVDKHVVRFPMRAVDMDGNSLDSSALSLDGLGFDREVGKLEMTFEVELTSDRMLKRKFVHA